MSCNINYGMHINRVACLAEIEMLILKKNIITDGEYELLVETDEAIQNAIKVDEFSFSGWKIETP